MKPLFEAAVNVSRHGPEDRRQEIATILLALFSRQNDELSLSPGRE
jgi:hypothetical protein